MRSSALAAPQKMKKKKMKRDAPAMPQSYGSEAMDLDAFAVESSKR